jgi:hypothetical protein
MRSTFQAGNQAAFLAVLQKFGALKNDPIANKGYELQKVALIKYTIPDAEVYFRRLK